MLGVQCSPLLLPVGLHLLDLLSVDLGILDVLVVLCLFVGCLFLVEDDVTLESVDFLFECNAVVFPCLDIQLGLERDVLDVILQLDQHLLVLTISDTLLLDQLVIRTLQLRILLL